jgi:DNA modification methylase
MKQQVKISKVKGNPNNPRVIKNDKFKKLVKSIQEFPEMLKLRPIVVDENMIVLGGNMRLKASKEAGLKEVWVEVAEGLTEEQKKEFIVKDNVGFGDWEWDMLANEWVSVQLAEWGLDVWENEDDKEPEAGLIEDDEIPEVKESKVKRGDIWQLGEHRIMCGDSTSSDDVDKLMNGEKADMVFTDPPYNIDFQGTMSCTSKDGEIITMKDGYSVPNSQYEGIKNDKKTKEEFKPFIEKTLERIKENVIGGWYVCFSSSTIEELLNPLIEKGMRWKSIIVWNKNQSPMGGGNFRKKYEPIVYGYFNNNFYGKEYSEDDVWDIDRTRKNDLHPTMKPIPLIEKAIGYSSKKDGSVLDLFLGSGSTLIAAEKLNRKCYGMELDEKYCDVIINRWEQFTGQKAIKNGTE